MRIEFYLYIIEIVALSNGRHARTMGEKNKYVIYQRPGISWLVNDRNELRKFDANSYKGVFLKPAVCIQKSSSKRTESDWVCKSRTLDDC